MTIFVSIASYCDPLLHFTLARALATASDPAAICAILPVSVPAGRQLARPVGGIGRPG
jgi:hypothetical protein